MGGIKTVPVECRHYETAELVDQDFENYIENGILREANSMEYYSWFWFNLFIWSLRNEDYTKTMTEILDCGISNDVLESKYANVDFYETKWQEAMAIM